MTGRPMDDPLRDGVFVPEAIAANVAAVERARTLHCAFVGVAAGVLGLTGVAGLIFFLAAAAVHLATLHHVSCSGQPSRFFLGGSKDIFNVGRVFNGINGMLTLVLVWTIVYDAIYIF